MAPGHRHPTRIGAGGRPPHRVRSPACGRPPRRAPPRSTRSNRSRSWTSMAPARPTTRRCVVSRRSSSPRVRPAPPRCSRRRTTGWACSHSPTTTSGTPWTRRSPSTTGARTFIDGPNIVSVSVDVDPDATAARLRAPRARRPRHLAAEPRGPATDRIVDDLCAGAARRRGHGPPRGAIRARTVHGRGVAPHRARSVSVRSSRPPRHRGSRPIVLHGSVPATPALRAAGDGITSMRRSPPARSWSSLPGPCTLGGTQRVSDGGRSTP